MFDAIAAGHLCVDIVPTISAEAATSDNFLAPGRLAEVGEARLTTGGSVSNTGLALARLGNRVQLLARLGDDPIADLTRQIISQYDPALTQWLGTGHGEPSSYTIVISPPGVDRAFLHCPGTNNTFGPEDLDDNLLTETRLFHFGYPPLMRRMFADGGIELSVIMRRAREQGATTSLDTAMPDPTQPSGQADWPLILSRTLPHVDLFLPSVEELLYMLRRERYNELKETVGQARMIDGLSAAEIQSLAEQTMHLGPRVLALKLGHRGLYVRSAGTLGDMGRASPRDVTNWQGRELWSPCFRVQVVNTVGAGDSAIAGFLTGLLRGQTIEEATNSAVAVGACNCEAGDSLSGVRPWHDTQARIVAGWEKHDIQTLCEDWKWDATWRLWRGPQDHS